MKPIRIEAPYLILVGDEASEVYAKTAAGIVQWTPERVAGQLRFTEAALDLGVPDMSIAQARDAGVRSFIIGAAPIGGVLPQSWWESVREAVDSGLDVVSGLHVRLRGNPEIVAAAKRSGSRLIDVRVPPTNLPIANGRKRSGKRVLMVGSDCSIGKKYTALALHRAMQAAGFDATFRATGQTGIMIAGEGVPIDSVVADFIAGAAEIISPDNSADHWDVIEGQGSLFHPAYAGVSLGLLHGSQPDVIVVCHDASRTRISGWNDFPLPGIRECIETNLAMGRLTNPDIYCAGVSINTSKLPPEERQAYLSGLSAEYGLPCVDPLIDGCDGIVQFLVNTVMKNKNEANGA